MGQTILIRILKFFIRSKSKPKTYVNSPSIVLFWLLPLSLGTLDNNSAISGFNPTLCHRHRHRLGQSKKTMKDREFRHR